MSGVCERCTQFTLALSVCCTAHRKLLCQTCYCLSHFVEVCEHPQCRKARRALATDGA